MHFATRGDFKSVVAGRMATFMAFIADHQHDKIGYLILTDDGLISSGHPQVDDTLHQHLISLSNPKASNKSATFQNATKMLATLLPPGSFLFIFSDFNDWTIQTGANLAPIVEKSTVLLCPIYDLLETKLPNDTLPFSNGTDNLVIPKNNDLLRQKFHETWRRHIDLIETTAQKYGWGLLSIQTNEDYLNKLSHFCFQGGINESSS